MKHKIEAIDYLRGLSILAIIVIHVLAWHDVGMLTEYTKLPFLFNLRDLLQFSVVTVIICSGFSLYLTNNQISLKPKELAMFYQKRIKRLLFPWWIFLIIFFSIHIIIKYLFNIELIDLSKQYILSSFLMLGGIGFGWLVLVMLILTLLFPFLKYLYDNVNKKLLFSTMAIAYLISMFWFNKNPLNILNFQIDAINNFFLITMVIPFIIGWSMIYMVGFLLEQFYNEHPSIRQELQLTFGFIGMFIVIQVVYNFLKLERLLHLNKYPPSPYYLSFGLMATFILLTIFFSYKHFIHEHLKRFLSFVSSNSYWLFMWNALTISLIIPFLSMFNFINVYFKLVVDIVLNIIGVTLLVLLQKKLIKIEMHLEKHHF